MFTFTLAGLLGYLLGSVPTAYILVHWKSNIDIRSAGSGNVGTLNSYEVTGSPGIGMLVLIGDVLKGCAPFLILRWLGTNDFSLEATAGVSAVLGHAFPVWLGFRGGRGLATGAAVIGLLCLPAVGFWGIAWGAGFSLTRRVNPANVVASIATLLAVVLAPEWLLAGALAEGVPPDGFRLVAVAVLLLVCVKLVSPLREYAREVRLKKAQRDGSSKVAEGERP